MDRQGAYRQAAQTELPNLESHFADCLAAYEEGFGSRAASELEAYVKRIADENETTSDFKAQQLLF